MDDTRIQRYAELVVRVGAAVREGSTVYVNAAVEHLDLVRAVTEQAYRAGAFRVVVDLTDARVRRVALEHAPMDALTSYEPWLLTRLHHAGSPAPQTRTCATASTPRGSRPRRSSGPARRAR